MAEATQEEVLEEAVQAEVLAAADVQAVSADVQVVSVEDIQAVQATVHHITEVQEARITDDQHHLHHRDIMTDHQEGYIMVHVVHHHADVCLVSLYLR